ncbi:MAG: hypothetical protein A2X99_05585 [Deltaproteobacteria bacterium GWB2_55_19]|nr:MAG: hypothetical protein A2X99_05585 [Deltaproteobacteria bacterium GWB2_55_19]
MEKDPEIKAMSEVANALSSLEPEAISRVLKWAMDRYQIKNSTSAAGVSQGAKEREIARDEFTDFASLYDATNPQIAIEKALVAAYWFQVVQNNDEFDSASLNRELRHLGHPSTNITRDLDVLISKSPRLALQIRKSGSTKQARKSYKLTTEGIKAVERMLVKSKELSITD